VVVDEAELHRGISEKMPMAFFKMSRSERARSSSRRSRAFSEARSAGDGPPAGAGAGVRAALDKDVVGLAPGPWISFCQRRSCEG